MQIELALVAIAEIMTFVQRRCQHDKLMPSSSTAQPFNQVSGPQPLAQTPSN